ATLTADIGARGYQRVMRAVDKMTPAAARLLQGSAYNRWSNVLSADQQEIILRRLVAMSDAGDADAPLVGMDLIRLLCHLAKKPLDTQLVPAAFELAARAPQYAHARARAG